MTRSMKSAQPKTGKDREREGKSGNSTAPPDRQRTVDTMLPLVRLTDWIQTCTEPGYLRAVLVWCATSREILFASPYLLPSSMHPKDVKDVQDTNPFYVTYEPIYRVKKQTVKFYESKEIHSTIYGLSTVVITPFITKLGRTSMILEYQVEKIQPRDTQGQKAFSFISKEEVLEAKRTLLATIRVVIVFTKGERPAVHPFETFKNESLSKSLREKFITEKLETWEASIDSQDIIKRLLSAGSQDLVGDGAELFKINEHELVGRPGDVDGVHHIHNANYAYILWDALFFFLSKSSEQEIEGGSEKFIWQFDFSAKDISMLKSEEFDIENVAAFHVDQTARLEMFTEKQGLQILQQLDKARRESRSLCREGFPEHGDATVNLFFRLLLLSEDESEQKSLPLIAIAALRVDFSELFKRRRKPGQL